MKLNKAQIAQVIDRVATAKGSISTLEGSIAGDIALLKKLGGGESLDFKAELIKMPARVMKVKAHVQLRITAK